LLGATDDLGVAEQALALVAAEPAEPTALADVELLHDATRLHLADAGQRFEHAHDLELRQRVVARSLVEQLAQPDGILYDPATHYLYIITGGENAKLDYSLISVVDTDKGTHLGDIRIEGGTMEEMRLEKSSARLFVVNREKNRIEVIDPKKRTILTSWPLTLGKLPVGLAIDESAHRLFVGCRSEVIEVLDAASGKEITSVPISKGIDGMVFDPATKRIYSEANTGAIDVYEEVDADHYRSLGTTPIGSPAKPGLLVPELNRYFVAVPQHDNVDAAILEYKVQ